MAELPRFFPEARVFAADACPHLSAACQVAAAAFKSPLLNDPSYIPFLLELCLNEEIGMVVPTIDTELALLADNQERFAEQGVHLIVSSSDLIRQFRNKRLTHDFFRTHSIPVPKDIDLSDPTFPIFVKPVDGSSSQGIAIAKNASQLAAIREEHEPGREFLFLEVIDRSRFDEFTVDLYYNRHHRLCCAIPRRRIEVRAGEVSKGITTKNDIGAFVQARLDPLPGAVGCLTLQLFRHQKQENYYGVEINPRFGGGYPLSYHAGASFPEWLIREHFLDEEIEWSDAWEDRLLMLRFDEEVLIHDAE